MNRYEEVDILREKLCGQIIIAKQLIHEKKLESVNEVLLKLGNAVEATKEISYCGQPVVNAVINNKAVCCQESGIILDVYAQLSETVPIQAVHLCSVFTNLLDNAIHACKLLTEREKWIQLIAVQEKGYLYILVKNPAENMEKDSRDGHGYGQKILADIAEIYQGEYIWECDESYYTARVSLKLDA